MSSLKPVAVITGAASGIGLALTQSCLIRGMKVVMADKALVPLEEQASLLCAEYPADVLAVQCDVIKTDNLLQLAQKTFDHFHRVDWLFNNAGISGHLAPLWELTDSELRHVMDVNLHGMIYGIQAFLPKMFEQAHRSHIINMASLYALCSGSLMVAYSMSKHAVLALSESLFFDLQRLNKPVDVSVACPSFVSTQLLESSKPSKNNELHSMMTDLIARSRPAADVADYIIKEVLKKKFYILPDKEVSEYCKERAIAISEEKPPHQHNMEKLVAHLGARLARKQHKT